MKAGPWRAIGFAADGKRFSASRTGAIVRRTAPCAALLAPLPPLVAAMILWRCTIRKSLLQCRNARRGIEFRLPVDKTVDPRWKVTGFSTHGLATPCLNDGISLLALWTEIRLPAHAGPTILGPHCPPRHKI
jgi:hypothetical protein